MVAVERLASGCTLIHEVPISCAKVLGRVIADSETSDTGQQRTPSLVHPREVNFAAGPTVSYIRRFQYIPHYLAIIFKQTGHHSICDANRAAACLTKDSGKQE